MQLQVPAVDVLRLGQRQQGVLINAAKQSIQASVVLLRSRITCVGQRSKQLKV